MLRLLAAISPVLVALNVAANPAPGWPSRSPDLDVLPGFKNPPAGYGEVPFWWWSGERLNAARLLWQIRELHEKGVSGVQVNYSHLDTPGFPTDDRGPAIFSDAWWDVYATVSQECARLDMGIGLSTYALDWPRGGQNLFLELFYSKPELNALELQVHLRERVQGGSLQTIATHPEQVALWAYEVIKGRPAPRGVDLGRTARDGQHVWQVPQGEWEIWQFVQERKPGTMNPLLPGSGATIVRDFFQVFEDKNPGKSAAGLNYFFNDELEVGVGKFAWNPDFAGEFLRRKGYALFEVLPAMWDDIGDLTPKVRMDYADVRMSLMEERYFKPIHDWHASRGLIFGSDSYGRGTEPNEFGDYFRATRWYTAPGHDTPGGNADLIKGKVSSSIANLYQRPRVWLEGYHSLGWDATPEQLMFATRENYLYGCSLLNLHGLYYSTYGSFWEWAPPSYHFRMPYWAHMDVFLGYFERLSYLMSQGHHVSDVAVVYPVAPYKAGLNGDAARDAAFDLGRSLMAAGIDFDFIDHNSLARATIENGRLVVEDANASYRALVFPNMEAVHWQSILRAAKLADDGGIVLSVGVLPRVSDRAGRNDPQLAEMVERAFSSGHRFNQSEEVVAKILESFVSDVRGVDQTVRALHRRAGFRDVYLVMDAEPGKPVEFRAKGAVELWDPWTGEQRPLRVLQETDTGTVVELPLKSYEAQVVVFTPGRPHVNPEPARKKPGHEKVLAGPWSAAFEPTMDNRFGDFRLPVDESNRWIGVEARRFAWSPETEDNVDSAMLPGIDDSAWPRLIHGVGPKFYKLGPIPEGIDPIALDSKLSALTRIDPHVPVMVGGQAFYWQPYLFSWRYGHPEDPGHQGFHGLKGKVSGAFIRLGRIETGPYGAKLISPEEHRRYYLWTAAVADEAVNAVVLASESAAAQRNGSPVIAPAAIFVNGRRLNDATQPVELVAGPNAVLLRFDDFGQAHVVLRRADEPRPEQSSLLAMPWYSDPAIIPFDINGGKAQAEWYRFRSAPGTTAIQLRTVSRRPPEVWSDGEPMLDRGDGRYEVRSPSGSAPLIAVRLVPEVGHSGAAAIAEPVVVETSGAGNMPLGDWSEMGILNNYSGGVRYRSRFSLTDAEVNGEVGLHLGDVIATAEVTINGKPAGVRVAPPWVFDLTGLLQPGENAIEILVYNTLSNHYQTVPSSYRGDPASGLFGPVRLSIAQANEE